MNVTALHEPDRHRFVVRLEDGEATLQYNHAGSKTLDFRSTFVPEQHRGRKIGDKLVVDALAYARTQGYSVIPSCPFVRTVVRRHSEYGDLIVEG
ncbi:MAG TPA: GNAT family N-acetyltransferase [Gemmatimonadota bacterium]|nr:GNAT family N-acetyltransferase [Gemmatimonadota bacterium]